MLGEFAMPVEGHKWVAREREQESEREKGDKYSTAQLLRRS